MIHTPNRTEQTHEGRCRTYGCKHRKAVFQPCRFLVDDLAYGTSYEGASSPLLFKLERTVLGMVVAYMNGMAGYMCKRLDRAMCGDLIFYLFQRTGCPALIHERLRAAATAAGKRTRLNTNHY